MESNQQDVSETKSGPEIRKTRSGRIVRPPTAPVKSPKNAKKKKKMVLMEVEVSDEEEASQDNENSSDVDPVAKENNESSKSKESEDDKKEKASSEKEETTDSSQVNDEVEGENEEKDEQVVNKEKADNIVEKMDVDEEPSKEADAKQSTNNQDASPKKKVKEVTPIESEEKDVSLKQKAKEVTPMETDQNKSSDEKDASPKKKPKDIASPPETDGNKSSSEKEVSPKKTSKDVPSNETDGKKSSDEKEVSLKKNTNESSNDQSTSQKKKSKEISKEADDKLSASDQDAPPKKKARIMLVKLPDTTESTTKISETGKKKASDDQEAQPKKKVKIEASKSHEQTETVEKEDPSVEKITEKQTKEEESQDTKTTAQENIEQSNEVKKAKETKNEDKKVEKSEKVTEEVEKVKEKEVENAKEKEVENDVKENNEDENKSSPKKKEKDVEAVVIDGKSKGEGEIKTKNEEVAEEKQAKENEEGGETKKEEEAAITKDSAEKREEKSDSKEDTAGKDELEKESEIEKEDVKSPDKKENRIKNEQINDPDTENISEDELPAVQVVKVPETEEVSDDELPGPKRAELPADTEVVSEDELPTVKKDNNKRKLAEGEYDPGSPTSEHEAPTKKAALETTGEKEKEEKPKPKKLPELDKYWKAVNDDPTDFTGWTYLLQYVDQENDMEAAREAYDAFLSHYPYCYGYWRKYADYEKRKGNKKKCEEVFERGFKAIPLSVDLWIHYMTYVKTTRADDEEYVRSQFERALVACGLEFRSDRLWDSYIKWETEGKRFQKVTGIYDRLLATPTQGYTSHFDNFQEHITTNPPNKVVEVDEFLALRKEVRHALKHDATNESTDDADAPPGDEDPAKIISSDEETKAIRERIISIRRKIHKNASAAVTARWNYEEGIKRPYFHVKPLERCQLKNWQDYLDYEIAQGDKTRTVVLFERCLIACALYEEFWLKFVHYLEGLKDPELQPKIRDVYERACTIHHLKKPNLHLQWAVFEESIQNYPKAAEILVNLERSVPNVLQIAYRRINLERRRGDNEKCGQLYEHYINNSKNKTIASNIAIKYSRFCMKITQNLQKAIEVLKNAMTKDPTNPRLYLQLIDLTLQAETVPEKEVTDIMNSFLEKEGVDAEQKVLFAQRKLEFLEDFGSDIQSVQKAYEDYHRYIKQNKDAVKKKETKSEPVVPSKKDSKPPAPSSTSNTYGNYGNYGNSSQGSYQYSGSQGQYGYPPQYGQGDQYQYQGWQYQQGNYGGYNQPWGSYGGGYGY